MSDSNSPTAAGQERVLTDPLRRLSTEKEMRFLMVGLDGAGKTTIMDWFGLNVVKFDSLGSHIESVECNNITIHAWDLNGEYETRNPPRHYFKNTTGLIFVVDITDMGRIDDARSELHNMLEKDLHKDVALLVYANKQDKHKGMKKEEIYERLGLSSPLGKRQCHVEITSAITGEGLYEGMDWLCQSISFTCAIPGEGVTRNLNLLRDSSANKKYDDDMPPGYTFQPTDEEFIGLVVKLLDGKEIYPNRVRRANLFEGHPAVLIRDSIQSGDHQPCMLGKRKYYLFYCRVPSEEEYVEGFGYAQIKDQSKGVWLPTKYSDYFLCNNESDQTSRWGEEQRFIYKPENQNLSCWKMVMYSLADIPRPESNMVLCKVYVKRRAKARKRMRLTHQGGKE